MSIEETIVYGAYRDLVNLLSAFMGPTIEPSEMGPFIEPNG